MSTPIIFISYRRSDCAGHAGRLADRLERTFGGDAVFRDIEDIGAGEDFSHALNTLVDRCDVFLALIGEDWLDSRDASGRRRIESQNDWVRHEISRALERNVRVIPILFQGAQMPSASDLPDEISGLARRNAFEIRDVHFERDVTALIDLLRPRWKRILRRTTIAAGVLLLLGLVAWAALNVYQGGSADRARVRLAEMGQTYSVDAFLDAVKHSDHRAVTHFLDAGMSVNATAEAGATAIQIVATTGDIKLAKLLLQRGASAGSALGIALFHDDTAMVDLLLAQEVGQPALDDALARAALNADVAMMDRLLALGANPRSANGAVWFDAVRAPSVAAVDWLLQRGLDPESVESRANGDTPLLRALSGPFSDRGENAESVQLAIVQRLVESGVAVNVRLTDSSSSRDTPLVAAISAQRTTAAQYLLDKGANIEDRSQGMRWPEYTPLLCAAEQGLEQVVDKLLAMGADVDARGKDEATALDRAISSGNVNIVERLLAAGADPNLIGKGKWTPLMLAASYDNAEMVAVLLQRGARVNEADRNGNTPLLIAASRIRFDHAETVLRLLAAGADPKLRNLAGKSSIDILRERERHDLLATLDAN